MRGDVGVDYAEVEGCGSALGCLTTICVIHSLKQDCDEVCSVLVVCVSGCSAFVHWQMCRTSQF